MELTTSYTTTILLLYIRLKLSLGSPNIILDRGHKSIQHSNLIGFQYLKCPSDNLKELLLLLAPYLQRESERLMNLSVMMNECGLGLMQSEKF